MNSKNVKIVFEYYDFNDEYALESAWAVKYQDYYKLNNILFYASEYALGDVVKVQDREGELFVLGLAEASGHSTIRIFFNELQDVEPTRKKLVDMGCQSEISNISELIAVDVPANIDYSTIKTFLEEGSALEKWEYEESCLRH